MRFRREEEMRVEGRNEAESFAVLTAPEAGPVLRFRGEVVDAVGRAAGRLMTPSACARSAPRPATSHRRHRWVQPCRRSARPMLFGSALPDRSARGAAGYVR